MLNIFKFNSVKRLVRLFCCVMAVVFAFNSFFITKAETVSQENIAYTDFTYWKGYSNKTPIKTSNIFTSELAVDLTAYGDTEKMELAHIVCDSNGNSYILDSGNGNIYVFDNTYKFVKTISSFSDGNNTYTFKGAKGLYFDKNDTLFVCDTAAKRVISIAKSGALNVLTKPDNPIIPNDYNFAPVRVIKDKNDFLYILCEGSFYGLLVLSDQNEMLGFFGASKVTVGVMDAITEWITSVFETQEKHEAGIKKLPYQMSDITVSASGFPVVVTTQNKGQIRMFAPTGSNILRTTSQFATVDGDEYNFGDFPNSFVSITSIWGTSTSQLFSGIASDDDGYIYALDATQGRIYMYDESCNLITVFGGGLGNGKQVGTFASPQSLVVDGDKIIVIDKVNKNLSVFKINNFGKKIKSAQNLTTKGDYEAAELLWEEILGKDKNCQLAYIGLAKSALMKKDYKTAMSLAKSGLDQKTYSQAYKFVRNDYISRNFPWMIAVAVLVIGGVIFLRIMFKKKGIVITIPEKIKVCANTMLKPIDTYNNITRKDLGSIKISIVLLVLFYISTVSKELFTSFSMKMTDITSFNAIYVLLGSIGTVILYVVINWSVCTLLEGKGKFDKVFISSCYALQPLILQSFLYIILSYVIIPTSNNSLGMINTIFTIVFVLWILLSITVVHDFSFFKAIGAGLLILLGMAIALFLIFIILTLGQDLIAFFVGIVNEALLRR